MNARPAKRACRLAAAAARHAGWRAVRPAPWAVSLDDDVQVGPRWTLRRGSRQTTHPVPPPAHGPACTPRPEHRVRGGAHPSRTQGTPGNPGNGRNKRPDAPAGSRLLAARRGVRTGIVTNQSGMGRSLISARQMLAVNRRIETLPGPFGVWAICPHDPAHSCDCRKPAPGLITRVVRRVLVSFAASGYFDLSSH
jgi:hypothetical protein